MQTVKYIYVATHPLAVLLLNISSLVGGLCMKLLPLAVLLLNIPSLMEGMNMEVLPLAVVRR